MLQNVAKTGESATKLTAEVDNAQVVAMTTLGENRQGERRRGRLGGSRTHDGGFAIRCLSHLATAPVNATTYFTTTSVFSRLAGNSQPQFLFTFAIFPDSETPPNPGEDFMPAADVCQRCVNNAARKKHCRNLSTTRRLPL